MKILQSLVVCEEYGAAEKFFPDFPAPREGALRYKCLYLYKAARKAEVFAGWRYVCEKAYLPNGVFPAFLQPGQPPLQLPPQPQELLPSAFCLITHASAPPIAINITDAIVNVAIAVTLS